MHGALSDQKYTNRKKIVPLFRCNKSYLLFKFYFYKMQSLDWVDFPLNTGEYQEPRGPN